MGLGDLSRPQMARGGASSVLLEKPLVLIQKPGFAHANSSTSNRTLSRLLEEDLEQPVGSEEMDQEQDETLLTGAVEQPDAPLQWSRSPREGLPLPEGSFQRLFSDLLASSRRTMPLGPHALHQDHPAHFVQAPIQSPVK
ncbi:C-type natriuretic peptide 1-like [Tiliqua scincoides]|uniref:C-type natriuretic peptide 1-like n=1 Tax=Tiliqua scincoides TaxID=71010 RepID=UPI003461C192